MPKKGQKRQPLTYEQWLKKIKNCHDYGWYTVYQCAVCGSDRFVVHHGCGLITCPECAKDYSRALTAKILEMTSWLASHKRSGYNLRILTLTMKPSGSMKLDVRRMQRSLKALWSRIGGDDRGFIAVLEVGKRGNVHAHCLYYGPWLSQEGLSELWHSLTGDSKVVWVEAPRGNDLKGAIAEIGKYVSKGVCEGNEAYLYEVYCAFYGRRRVIEYGLMLGTTKLEPIRKPCPICGCTDVEAGRTISREEYEKIKKMLDTC